MEKYGKRIDTSDLDKIMGDYGKKILKFSLITIICLIVFFGSIYTIKAGYRGVLLTFGKPNMNVMEEGLHFKVPIVQSVKKMEVRKQKIEVSADSASMDLQDVMTTIALNFHLSASQVPKLYQEIGKDYSDRIISPAIQESVKATTAKFTAEELITRRSEVRDSTRDFITEKLKKYYIVVDDFNIVDFQFSEQFDKAIEAKVTAEQLKLKAEKDLERIKVEALQAEAEAIGIKNAKIAKAQGEAKAIEVVEKQLSKSRRYVEWYKINKWNGELPTVTAGMPFIDVTPKIQATT